MKRTANRKKWASKPSRYYAANHILDYSSNYGYDYHGNVFKKSVSSIIFDSASRLKIMYLYEVLVCYIIDSIKMIKKCRNYAIDKKSIKLK